MQTVGLHPGLQSAGAVRTLQTCLAFACSPSPASLLVSIALAACGGAGGAADADPAKAVPAGTAIYFEGVVRPEGDQREDVLDAAGKVLRTDDPEAKIRELIDQGLKESDGPAVDYEKDIAPWLGEKAGVWVTGVDREKPGYMAVIATKDTEEAQKAIDKAVEDEGSEKNRSYEDVDYHGRRGRRGGRHRRRLPRGRHRAGVQAHGQGRAGRRLAGRRQALQGRGRRDRGRPPRPLLHRPQAVLRAGDQDRPRRRRAVASSSARSSRSTSSSRWPARCWPTATGSRSTRS